MNPPKCYLCKYRGDLVGDCHSKCNHPKAFNEIMFFMSEFAGITPPKTDRERSLNIKGNFHGIKNGWFCWPVNFDPIWLENCNGFKPLEETKGGGLEKI